MFDWPLSADNLVMTLNICTLLYMEGLESNGRWALEDVSRS